MPPRRFRILACEASWAQMSGDERVRHCAHCRSEVHDVRGESPEELAENFERHVAAGHCVRVAAAAAALVGCGPAREQVDEQVQLEVLAIADGIEEQFNIERVGRAEIVGFISEPIPYTPPHHCPIEGGAFETGEIDVDPPNTATERALPLELRYRYAWVNGRSAYGDCEFTIRAYLPDVTYEYVVKLDIDGRRVVRPFGRITRE